MSHSPRSETNISVRNRPSALHSSDYGWWDAQDHERNSSTSEPPMSGTAFTSTLEGMVHGSYAGFTGSSHYVSSMSSHHGPGSSDPWALWDVDVPWPSTTLALEAPSQTTKGGLCLEPMFDVYNGFDMEKTSPCNPLGFASLGSWIEQDVHASGLSTAGTRLMSTLPTAAVDPLLAHRVTAHDSFPSAYSLVESLESPGTHLNTDADGQSSLVPAFHYIKPDDAWSTLVTSSRDTDVRTGVQVCPHCAVTFTGRFRKGNLGRHLRLLHNAGGSRYTCPDCEKLFNRTDSLLLHVRKSHRNTAHALQAVQRRRRSPSTGRSARETSASPAPKGKEGIHCSICQETFGRLPDLRRHMNSKHDPVPMQHICPFCAASFARKDKCADHVRRQHGSASYAEGELDRHRHPRLEDAIKLPRVQEAPDMYTCTEHGCNKTFDSNAELLRHQRSHLSKDERPFKCEECPLSFLYPKDLERHANTHKDDDDETKPTIHCRVSNCEYEAGKKSFSRRDALARHMRRAHPGLTTEDDHS